MFDFIFVIILIKKTFFLLKWDIPYLEHLVHEKLHVEDHPIMLEDIMKLVPLEVVILEKNILLEMIL